MDKKKKTSKKPKKNQEKEPELEKPEKAEEKPENKEENKEKQPIKTWKKAVLLGVIFIIVLAIGGCYQFFSGTLNKIIDTNESKPLYQQLNQLVKGNDGPLKGEAEDQINVLLLGMGGSNHSGGTLTDTIMIASIKPSTNQVALVSLPRDLVIKVYDEDDEDWWEGRKINYAYEIGGIDFSIEKVEEVTGLDMHYYVLSDFSGFMKIIDDIGGVEIDVTNRFNGYYHIADVGGTCIGADGGPVYLAEGDGPYCIFKFFRGQQKMDGATALRFSRIRKVAYSAPDNEYYEGSDFARAKRQQQILEAFKSKALSTSTLANPVKITNALNSLGDHLRTSLELWEMAKLGMMAQNISRDNIISYVIDDSVDGLVEGKIYAETGAFVVTPKAGDYDYSEIQDYIANIFAKKQEEEQQADIQEEIEQEQAIIIVLNGTHVEGLAADTKLELEKIGLTVAEIDNAPLQDSTETKIYDLTKVNPLTVETLENKLTATTATQDFAKVYPDNEVRTTDIDFIIVLGQEGEL